MKLSKNPLQPVPTSMHLMNQNTQTNFHEKSIKFEVKLNINNKYIIKLTDPTNNNFSFPKNSFD